MVISIYNSLTRKKEELKPLDGKTIRMYSCGVTVYDKCHIGHARSLYIFDVIRRYLKYRGLDVKFVRNITDIDDKIIKKANETGKTSQMVAEENIAAYYKDLESLGIGKADFEPKATENIPEMIAYIEGLIKKDFAYAIQGDVYFRVRKFKDYGKLSGQSVEKMLEGVRIDKDEKKEDPLDFALWKASKEGEPSWPSPWGPGRPGWHIECSVMSQKYLKCDTLDIHAGGRDLIFPHHENEIAQSEALTGKPFAKYWIHHGLLTINGQKMAKSLGNFITIEDTLKKYGANVLKLFSLSSHYGSNIDFSEKKMEEAKGMYERIVILLERIHKEFGTHELNKIITGGAGESPKCQLQFQEVMDDDFNTPRALAVLFELVNRTNKTFDSSVEDRHFLLKSAVDVIKEILDVFGVDYVSIHSSERSDDRIQDLVNMRDAFKKDKLYQKADQVRQELEEEGIILEDTKQGTTWRRKI
jgi:cysteinyl-tRNA synthetase